MSSTVMAVHISRFVGLGRGVSLARQIPLHSPNLSRTLLPRMYSTTCRTFTAATRKSDDGVKTAFEVVLEEIDSSKLEVEEKEDKLGDRLQQYILQGDLAESFKSSRDARTGTMSAESRERYKSLDSVTEKGQVQRQTLKRYAATRLKAFRETGIVSTNKPRVKVEF